jgi:hypothetical protein
VLDRLEAGVRAGACSDPSKSRGIDNTASPVEAAAVDQRRNACPVGERTVASIRHDEQEPQPRPCPGRLLLKTRPDSVAVTDRCSCFAAGEQQYLLLAGAGTAVLPLRRAKEGALRAPSRSCASRPLRKPRWARAWRPRSWRSSSAGVSRPTPSQLAPPAAQLALGRQRDHAPRGGGMTEAIVQRRRRRRRGFLQLEVCW